jgi:hypothetical protein
MEKHNTINTINNVILNDLDKTAKRRMLLVISATVLLSLVQFIFLISWANATNIEFKYDEKTGVFDQTVTGTPMTGGAMNIYYRSTRKDVIFKHQDRLWMRYSFDGWKTCTDTQFFFNARIGEFVGNINVPMGVAEVSMAFFSTYEFAGGYHKIWDSKYGKNFTLPIVDSRDREAREKFETLQQMEK